MSDCVFCQIGSRELPAMVVYEDREFLAFRDINPQAPVHILVVPKRHCNSILDFQDGDDGLLGRMVPRLAYSIIPFVAAPPCE